MSVGVERVCECVCDSSLVTKCGVPTILKLDILC